MYSGQLIGPVYKGDGSVTSLRGERSGALVTADGHGRYQEAVSRGNVWTLATASAGITVGANEVVTATGGKPLVGILVPNQSASPFKAAVILKGTCVYNSGTTGAGGMVWGILAPPSAVTAAGGNGAINALTLVTGGSFAKTFVDSALTGGGAGVVLTYIGGMTVGAIAANGPGQTINEEAGDIICPPNGVVGIFAAAAGTSPIVSCSMVWEEVSL